MARFVPIFQIEKLKLFETQDCEGANCSGTRRSLGVAASLQVTARSYQTLLPKVAPASSGEGQWPLWAKSTSWP
jgi:hypothetical protein